jgi:hypothetical protein
VTDGHEGGLPFNGHLETLHDKAAILLRRAQIHWNIGTLSQLPSLDLYFTTFNSFFQSVLQTRMPGVRLFLIALLVGAWTYSPIVLLIVTVLFILILYYYDHV